VLRRPIETAGLIRNWPDTRDDISQKIGHDAVVASPRLSIIVPWRERLHDQQGPDTIRRRLSAPKRGIPQTYNGTLFEIPEGHF
jgi:hypothetical protein